MENVCCKLDPEVKQIRFGFLIEEPREEETMILLSMERETIQTSVVEKFLCYENKIWIVETQNSIYVLQQ